MCPGYEQAHNRRFIWLVGPGVLVTLASAVALLAGRPSGVPLVVVAALALLAVIIASTIGQGAPSHTHLAVIWDADVHTRLVRTNWIRTLAWSALGALGLIALALSS